MRRLLFSALALSWVGLLAGCHGPHTHGVCDCDIDDLCCNRQPWVKGHVPAALGAPEPVEAPLAAPVEPPVAPVEPQREPPREVRPGLEE